MKTILFLIQKEFLQIFRNKGMLPLIFAMPIIQLLILANAATYETRNINLHVVDQDQSQTSRRLIGKFQASPWFEIMDASFSHKLAQKDLEHDRADLILEVPVKFEEHLVRTGGAQLHLDINAINGAKAGIVANYAQSIITDFNREIAASQIGMGSAPSAGQIHIEYANWFNPDMDFQTFMVPGILVLLVTMIGLFLTGMNIVREKEIGTIEQINVTPIKKYQFIIGKLTPLWIIGMFELAFGLVIGVVAFRIPVVGELWLIFAFAALYLFVVLGMGLLISTFTETQQQAMFLAWFFMVIFILMSGLFTPIESMPVWAQKITLGNPIAYFVKVIRMVLLKGSGFRDIRSSMIIMAVFAVVINGLAMLTYRKKTA